VARCLVGSADAQRKALVSGLTSDQVRVTGLPVNPRFTEGLVERAEAHKALGWGTDQPAALMVGGGEGMGQLYRTARAIDRLCSGVQIAVVAGRNRKLLQRLQSTSWRQPMHIYGFVDHTLDMPRLMSAADLLITKAGPGTLHEAFLAGLPLLLSGAVPGQEEGNVRLVVEGAARPTQKLVARRVLAVRDGAARITRGAARTRPLEARRR
jgi:1,2-diacylglycerol 3-beta-galactosyltransferase